MYIWYVLCVNMYKMFNPLVLCILFACRYILRYLKCVVRLPYVQAYCLYYILILLYLHFILYTVLYIHPTPIYRYGASVSLIHHAQSPWFPCTRGTVTDQISLYYYYERYLYDIYIFLVYRYNVYTIIHRYTYTYSVCTYILW